MLEHDGHETSSVPTTHMLTDEIDDLKKQLAAVTKGITDIHVFMFY